MRLSFAPPPNASAPQPKQPMTPLRPGTGRVVSEAFSADGQYGYVREDDDTTTWTIVRLADGALSPYWPSLPAARRGTASGAVQFDAPLTPTPPAPLPVEAPVPRTATLSPDALGVLRAATVTDTAVVLPPGQLDRKVYAEVDKALKALGGKWNRGQKAHLFDRDPRQQLSAALSAGVQPVNQDKALSYFRTPDTLAAHVVGALAMPANGRVLEPSAGDGSLVAALRTAYPRAWIEAVEVDHLRAQKVKGADACYVTEFEDYATDVFDPWFHAVVMNPPFTLPGDALAYVEHIRLAWDLVLPGGQLLAIAPASLATRQDGRVARLRDRIEAAGGSITPLEPRAFRESGTDVFAVLVDVCKPE